MIKKVWEVPVEADHQEHKYLTREMKAMITVDLNPGLDLKVDQESRLEQTVDQELQIIFLDLPPIECKMKIWDRSQESPECQEAMNNSR